MYSILHINGYLMAQAEIPGSVKSSFSTLMMAQLPNVRAKLVAIRGKVQSLQIISSYFERTYAQFQNRAAIICSSFIPRSEQLGNSFSTYPHRSLQIRKYSHHFIDDVIRQLTASSTPQCLSLVVVDSTPQRLRGKGLGFHV